MPPASTRHIRPGSSQPMARREVLPRELGNDLPASSPDGIPVSCETPWTVGAANPRAGPCSRALSATTASRFPRQSSPPTDYLGWATRGVCRATSALGSCYLMPRVHTAPALPSRSPCASSRIYNLLGWLRPPRARCAFIAASTRAIQVPSVVRCVRNRLPALVSSISP